MQPGEMKRWLERRTRAGEGGGEAVNKNRRRAGGRMEKKSDSYYCHVSL